jgi:hypothetical protein
MSRRSIAAVALMGLVVGAGGVAVAEESGTAQAPFLRMEWQFESARGNYRNACGRVLNDRDMPARHVMIMFEGFDADGKRVSRRFAEVVGDVPGRGYSIFCLMVKAGAAKYQASLPAVDWGPAGQ